MAIPQAELIEFSRQQTTASLNESVKVAKSNSKQTAFLCHSHRDERLALGVQSWLHNQGWELYIDWLDASMNSTPDKYTAQKIQKHILSRDWFLYLATSNSTKSKWCPWEIGFADGAGKSGDIIVLRTSSKSTTYGQEYLQLYRFVSKTKIEDFRIFEAGARQSGKSLSSLTRGF